MGFLDNTGVTRLVTDLKTKFAALVHTHAASDITSGTLAVARGGTNASTAAAARTNLDAAQSESASGSLYDAEQAIADNAADIATLQDSVSGTLISNTLTYTKRAGIVTVVGYNVPVEEQGQTLGTMPTGLRPNDNRHVFLAHPQWRDNEGTTARVVIQSDGKIRFYGNVNASPITFCATFIAG